MSKETFVKTLGVIVTISGLAVIIGWLYDIPVIKSISPNWISMKFITAISFVLSGFILYFITQVKTENLAAKQIVLSVAALSILMIMVTFIAGLIFGIHTGLEGMFVYDIDQLINVSTPGRPSIPAIICFILTAVSAILVLLEVNKLKFLLKTTGIIIALIALTAVAGYVFNIPPLYYSVKNISNPIAFHAAALFIVVGTGIFIGSDLQ